MGNTFIGLCNPIGPLRCLHHFVSQQDIAVDGAAQSVQFGTDFGPNNGGFGFLQQSDQAFLGPHQLLDGLLDVGRIARVDAQHHFVHVATDDVDVTVHLAQRGHAKQIFVIEIVGCRRYFT